MAACGNLWAVGYDTVERANQVCEEIISLGWDKHYLFLDDVAVVIRHPDGSLTLTRKKISGATNIVGSSVVGFLAGLVLGAPITGATVGALVGSAGTAAVVASAGIIYDFVKEVEALMKPGTSAIFVLDDEGDMDVILHKIRGLGGTVLKTNVDLEHARLIQTTLAAPPEQTTKSVDKA